MTSNRKILLLGIMIMGALIFFGGALMIVRQSGLARLEKQNYFAKRARERGSLLTQRLNDLLVKASIYTNSSKIAEIFTEKAVNLRDFPEDFRSGIKRVRIADGQGTILFSSSGSLDQGSVLSSQVLSLAQRDAEGFTVFTPNRNTVAALARYGNPRDLRLEGYILFEFNMTAVFRNGLGDVEPVVRVENGVPLLVMKDSSTATYDQIASFDLFRPQPKNAPLTGLILRLPHMGNVVYYVGSEFHFPLWLSLAAILGFILSMGALALYLRGRGETVAEKSYTMGSAQEIKDLFSDIERGKTYPRKSALDILKKAIRFGALPKEEIEEEPEEPIVKEESTVSAPERKPFVFGSLDEDLSSLEEIHEQKEFALPEDKSDSSDDVFLDDEHDFSALKDEETSLSQAFEEIGVVHFTEKKSHLERYEDHLNQLQEPFGITHRAKASNNEGLFLLDDKKVFGKDFQITAEDPIFQDILSKGKILSLSGSLEESEYLAHLIDGDILQDISDLFIVPILDDEDGVSHVVVLGRNKTQRHLTMEEKTLLFSY